MTRPSILAWFYAAILLLGASCAASETPSPSDSEQCEDVGEDCSCDDGSSGETVCTDGASECSCEGVSDEDDSVGLRDAGSARGRDAGKDSGSSSSSSSSSSRDAGARSDAGSTGSEGGSTRDAGGGSTIARDSGVRSEGPITTPPATGGGGGGGEPVIPPMPANCPEFRSGTATIGGLGGISLQVGAKKEGTGSLVFYWHGTGSSSAEASFMFPAAARSEILGEGGIIVAFQGSTRRGGDCSGTGTFSQGDFEIADQIVACAVKNHGINPRRIYTTGCSAGGLQAGCMASRRSGYIAAAVPNSGGVVFPQPIQDPKHIPAVMTMHGSAADTVIVTFSQTSATLGNQFQKAGGFVVNCNHGGGHCAAPGALYTAGWKFMKDHPFGLSPEPYASGLPSGFPAYCKILGK